MKELNKKCNILISCHKDFYIPNLDCFIPIQVGAANAKQKFDMLQDDKGDNISNLNPYFCELTAQYWAWKNLDSDYLGFFHYRRYLMLENKFPIGRELVVYDNINDLTLSRCGLIDNDKIIAEVSKYDIILPNKCKCHPYEHYKTSDQHHIQDLDFMISLIHERCPEFDKYVKKALYGDYTYFWNIYIMKKQYFKEYCEWLFPLLFEFQNKKCYDNCSVYEKRTPGLLAERMLTIFVLYLKDKYKDIKIKEVPTALFEEVTNPNVIPAYKEKNAICYEANKDTAKYLSVSLSSLLANSNEDNHYDIVVFDNGLSFHQKTLLLKQMQEYKNASLRFVRTINYSYGLEADEASRTHKPSLGRLVIFDLLNNYNKALYLDCKTIINNDLDLLFQVDLKDNFVGAVLDIFDTKSEHDYIWNNASDINRNKLLDEQRFFKRFDIGVLLYNFAAIKNIHAEDLYKRLEETNWHLSEKDLLHEVFHGKVEFIDSGWNYRPESDVPINELISIRASTEHFNYYLKGKNNPFIINFSDNNPIFNDCVDCSDMFFKFARNSLFYEELILEMNEAKTHSIINEYKEENKTHTFKGRTKRLLKKLFPRESRRGRFIRKLFKRK